VSFGADRFFHLKHKNQKELRLKIPLTSGSLLLMEGETQTHWLHQVAKTNKLVGPRINLTFRKII
jgi:alkylated DNA repair dioxygenase AlkB